MMKQPVFLSIALLLYAGLRPCAAQEANMYTSNTYVRSTIIAPPGDLSHTALYKRSKDVKKWQRRRFFGYCNLVSGSGHFAFFTYIALKEKDRRWALISLPFGAVAYLGLHSIRKANKNLAPIRQNQLMLNVTPRSVTLCLKM